MIVGRKILGSKECAHYPSIGKKLYLSMRAHEVILTRFVDDSWVRELLSLKRDSIYYRLEESQDRIKYWL
jgi:hypothetical protein